MNTEDAAEIMGLSSEYVRSLVSEKALPSVKLGGERWIPRPGLDLYMERRDAVVEARDMKDELEGLREENERLTARLEVCREQMVGWLDEKKTTVKSREPSEAAAMLVDMTFSVKRGKEKIPVDGIEVTDKEFLEHVVARLEGLDVRNRLRFRAALVDAFEYLRGVKATHWTSGKEGGAG